MKIKTIAHEALKIVGDEWSARPYNFYDPEKTTWWLVPSKEWPAYKFGKIFFNSSREVGPITIPENSIFCGFYIEKGLGDKTALIYGKKSSLIMRSDWLWEEFIKKLSDKDGFGDFFDGEDLVVKMSYLPTEKGDFFDSPEAFLAQKEQFGNSFAVFCVEKTGEIKLKKEVVNNKNLEIANFFKETLVKSKNIHDLATNLLNIPGKDWVWVDLYVGKIYDSDSISIEKMWGEEIKKWISWAR